MKTNWYDLAKRWTDKCIYCGDSSYKIVGSVCNTCKSKRYSSKNTSEEK